MSEPDTTASSSSSSSAVPADKPAKKRLEKKPARGLLLWSIVALVLSPFSIPTFGVGLALGIGLIVVAAVMQHRGFSARGPLAAGIIAVTIGLASAGACGWLVLRPAEVKGREAVRQERVENRFDRFFSNATDAPPDATSATVDGGMPAGDAGVPVDADSAPTTMPAAGGPEESR